LRRRRIHVAENKRQAVFGAANDHDLGIRGLGELKRRLDAAPAQVQIRDPLADDHLELAYAFGFDLLAFKLPLLALDAEFVFFRNVVLFRSCG
jgi:hypothetical protein